MTTNNRLHNHIIDFIESYEGTGFGGDCLNFALELNRHIKGIGTFYLATNEKAWQHALKMIDKSTNEVYWQPFIGHMVLEVKGSFYDVEGEVADLERVKSWGELASHVVDEHLPSGNTIKVLDFEHTFHCVDCESFEDDHWRTGRCDDCHGSGGEECPNCDGTGSPRCCRCEGSGMEPLEQWEEQELYDPILVKLTNDQLRKIRGV